MPNRDYPSRFRWGSNYTGSLICADPLDNAVAYVDARDGSEFKSSLTGYEDAWLVGEDHVLEADVRHIPSASGCFPLPATGYENPNGWRAAIRWARNKEPLVFFPDGRNLMDRPRCTSDENADSLADGWSLLNSGYVGGYSHSVNATDGQGIVASPAGATQEYVGVNQTLYNVVIPGAVYWFGIDVRCASLSGSVLPTIKLQFKAADGELLNPTASLFPTATTLTRYTTSVTAPVNAVHIDIAAYLLSPALSDSGKMWLQNVTLTTQPNTTTFVDTPASMSVYLTEPMEGGWAREANGERRVRIKVRSASDTAFTGY